MEVQADPVVRTVVPRGPVARRAARPDLAADAAGPKAPRAANQKAAHVADQKAK
ncbi:MAG: hypothetical protein ACRDP6_38210 [Actinoallomurus sp.]